MSTTDGERRNGSKVGGNTAKVSSGRGLISYMVNTKVCISVNFPSHPSGGCRDVGNGV